MQQFVQQTSQAGAAIAGSPRGPTAPCGGHAPATPSSPWHAHAHGVTHAPRSAYAWCDARALLPLIALSRIAAPPQPHMCSCRTRASSLKLLQSPGH
eukprot:767143-Amphidinium_carterae.1